MPKASGPTIARWQLGHQIKALREAARMTHQQVADILGCSESKIYKIEAGDVGINRGDLLVMLGRYGIAEDDPRGVTALDLQKQGKQRGWWSKYGSLPVSYALYVGLEGAAAEIKNFELAVIPGLLQTPAYAHAVIAGSWPDSAAEVQRRVDLRMERQAHLTDEPSMLRFWAVVDEAVLHRRTGGAAVMKEQLVHLLAIGSLPHVTLQVLPFGEGHHPGTIGSFSILEFPEGVHSPVAYVVSQAGDLYLERDDDMRRVGLSFTHLQTAALSEARSRDMIKAIAGDIA